MIYKWRKMLTDLFLRVMIRRSWIVKGEILRSKVYRRRDILALASFLLIFPLLSFASSSVILKDGRITIQAEGVPILRVAELISKEMGIDVYIDRSEQGRIVNVNIQDMPVEKGLRRLAYPLNYAIFSREGKIRELRIFRSAGLKEEGYVVIRGEEAQKDAQPKALEKRSPLLETQAREKIKPEENALKEKAEVRESYVQATPVTGEKALAYNIWLNKRLAEMNSIKEQMQIMADKAHETIPVVQSNLPTLQIPIPEATPSSPAETESGVGGEKYLGLFEMKKMVEGQSQLRLLSFQQRAYANYLYYQQRMGATTQYAPNLQGMDYYYRMSILKGIYGRQK